MTHKIYFKFLFFKCKNVINKFNIILNVTYEFVPIRNKSIYNKPSFIKQPISVSFFVSLMNILKHKVSLFTLLIHSEQAGLFINTCLIVAFCSSIIVNLQKINS